MKRFSALLLGTTLLAACGDDEVTVEKGEVDRAALEDEGVTVMIDADMGSVEIPMITMPPTEDYDDLRDELEDAVSLVVTSDMTGASADLAAGTAVEEDPSAPGGFAWTFNDDTVTLNFYNETPGGLTLKNDRTYTAQFAVTMNSYIRTVPNVDVDVDVQ